MSRYDLELYGFLYDLRLDRQDFQQTRLRLNSFEGIPQRASVPGEMDSQDIAPFQPDPLSEAECVRAKKVNVQVSGMPVPVELEMVMFQVRQRMGHVLLAAANVP